MTLPATELMLDLRRSNAAIWHSITDLRLIHDDFLARQARRQAIEKLSEHYKSTPAEPVSDLEGHPSPPDPF